MGSCVSSTAVKPKKEPPRSNQVVHRDESYKNAAPPLSAWNGAMDPSGLPTYFAGGGFARSPFAAFPGPGGAAAVQVYYIPEASVIALAPPFPGTAMDLLRPAGAPAISGVSRVSRDPYWWVSPDWLPPAVPESGQGSQASLHADVSSSSALRLASSPRAQCADLAPWQADGGSAKGHGPDGHRARGGVAAKRPAEPVARREPCYLLKLQSASDSLFDYLLASDHQRCSVPLDAIAVALPLALAPPEEDGRPAAHGPARPASPVSEAPAPPWGREASNDGCVPEETAAPREEVGPVTPPVIIRRRSHAHIRLDDEETPSPARLGRPASTASSSPRPSEGTQPGLAALFDPDDSLSALMQSPSCASTFEKFRPSPTATTPRDFPSPRKVEKEDLDALRLAQALIDELSGGLGTPPHPASAASSSPRPPLGELAGERRGSPESPRGRRSASAGPPPPPPAPVPAPWLGPGPPRSAPSLSPMPRQRLLEDGGLVGSPHMTVAGRRASADCLRPVLSKWPEGEWQPTPAPLLPTPAVSRRCSSSSRRSQTVPGGGQRQPPADGSRSPVRPRGSPRRRLLSHLAEHARRHEQQLMPAAPVPGGTTTLSGPGSMGYGPAPSDHSSLAYSTFATAAEGPTYNKMVCGICWRMMHVEQHASLLPCGHVFHTQCMTTPAPGPVLHTPRVGASASAGHLEAAHGRPPLGAPQPSHQWRSTGPAPSTASSAAATAGTSLTHRAARLLGSAGPQASPARAASDNAAPSSSTTVSPGLRLLNMARGKPSTSSPAPLPRDAPGSPAHTTATSLFAHFAASSQSSTAPSIASRVPKAPSSVDLALPALGPLRFEAAAPSCASCASLSPTAASASASALRPRALSGTASPRSSTPSLTSGPADPLPPRGPARHPGAGAPTAHDTQSHQPNLDYNPDPAGSSGGLGAAYWPAGPSAADIPRCPLCLT